MSKIKVIVEFVVIVLALCVGVSGATMYLMSTGKIGNKQEANNTNTNTSNNVGLVLDDSQKEGNPESTTSGSELSSRNVYFAGIEDATISATTEVYLENLEDNEDFLMKYIIYEGNTLIYESNLIKAGNYISWVPGETLSAGEHHLSFTEVPYYVDKNGEYCELTNGVNEVTLIIE
jgi:hypothetical protein